MPDRPDPYVRKDPGDIIRSSDWNELQVKSKEEIHSHQHKGGDDGALIPREGIKEKAIDGSRIDPEASVTIKDLTLQKGIKINEFSSDTALPSSSDSVVSTQKAVKEYTDKAVNGLQIRVQEEIRNHQHKGGDDGTLIPREGIKEKAIDGSRIDPEAEVIVKTLTVTETIRAKTLAGDGHVDDLLSKITGMDLPVGSIIAWHKSLSGTPALPDKWVECNGQTITAKDSPYYGQVVPNLNGDGRFLRGSQSSGSFQQDQDNSIDHIKTHQDGVGPGDNAIPNSGWSDGIGTGEDSVGGPDVRLQVHKPGNETRPKNMSVVWIMKIK